MSGMSGCAIMPRRWAYTCLLLMFRPSVCLCRFQMDHEFNATHGVFSYQLSNPCVLSLSAVYGSMQVLEETSMEALRRKSLALTRCVGVYARAQGHSDAFPVQSSAQP